MIAALRCLLFCFALSACQAANLPLTTAQPLPQSAFAEDEPVDEPEVIREDFDALYSGLQSAHYNLFINRSNAYMDARHDEMRAGFNRSLRRTETEVIFQRFIAHADVAHARIDFPSAAWDRYLAAGGRFLPLYPRVVGEKVFVAEVYAEDTDIRAGDELIAIDGVGASEWITRTSRNISAETPYMASTLLEFGFPARLWLEIGERAEFEVTVRGVKGQATHPLSALTRQEKDKLALRGSDFFVFDGETREARMLTEGLAYLRPGPFYHVENPDVMWDNSAFIPFIDEAFATFKSNGAQALIIDLRDNPGGDAVFSDVVMGWFATEPYSMASSFRIRSSVESQASNQARINAHPALADGISGVFAERYASVPYGEAFELELPIVSPRTDQRFEGQVYVLINRHTYSNAVNVAAIVQDYGFGTIIGEKTSDSATVLGAMETFKLPNTGIIVGYPKALIVRPSGAEVPDGVTPDIVIETPIVSGTDAVLSEAIIVVSRIRAAPEE